EEAAERLHKSRRWLQDWLRDHPADSLGKPFYAQLGRTKVFTDDDLRRILAAAMEDERCRLNSSPRGRPNMRHGGFAAPTSGSTLTKAGGPEGKHSRRKSAEGSNVTSKVVSWPTNRQRALRQPPRHT